MLCSSHLTRFTRDISQLTDKKSPSCTLFDIGVLFCSRSHHLYLTESRSPSCTLFDIGALFRSRSHLLYLTESRSPFCTLFDIGALFRSRSHHLYLTESRSPSCTLFDIGALFRSRSHPLYLTESRSPFFCHWQRSSLFLSRSARYSVQNQRGASPSLAPLVFHGTSFSFLLSLAAVVLGSSQLTDKKSPSSRHRRRSFTCPLFVRLISLAPLVIFRNSQIKNLPSSATGSGRTRLFATHR